MHTRSQSKSQSQKLQIYTVDIDFDEASRAWKSNKKSIGNGQYQYVCEYISKTGKKCKKQPFQGCSHCNMHYKYLQ